MPVVRRLCLGRGATIFTLHRFAHPDGDADGLSPAVLDQTLARLRADGFRFVSLESLVRAAREQQPLPDRSIAFTVDDGYFDFAEVAAPVFASHDCPVTMFVVTGFLDGTQWMWWDKVSLLFDKTRHNSVELDGVVGPLSWSDDASKDAVAGLIAQSLKRLSTAEKLRQIDCLAEALEVDLPDLPPSKYRPMSWQQARECSRGGADFAPHSVTHPILSRASDEQVRAEIAGSWQRVRDEVPGALPLFAYPNGGADDYGAREIGLLQESGMLGAVTTRPGHVRLPLSGDDCYQLPRWDLTPDRVRMDQVVSGLEAAKAGSRQALRRR